MAIGDAYINVHANTNPFEREVREGVEHTGKDADKILDEIGTEWGKVLSDSTSKEVEKHGKDLARSVERSTEHVTFKVKGKWDVDNGVVRDARGRFVKKITDGIEGEIDTAIRRTARNLAGPNGPFQTIASGIRGALTSGFNLGEQNPAQVFLPFLIGGIVALVVAALQAINALVAVVATLPALLFAVGIQAGVVLLAFHGMGTAIQGALAAKNAKELNDAIKDLTPSAQEFVKSIVRAKDQFKEIQKITQEGFFKGLGDIIGPLVQTLQIFKGPLGDLAVDLGEFFRGIALFFASTPFRQFLTDVLPATGKFLDRFGPAFVQFLLGLIKFSDAALPFLTALGGLASNIFKKWGDDLGKLAKDPATMKWFSDMEDTLQSVRDLFGAITDFVVVLLAEIDQANGIGVIDELAKAFDQITFFLSTDVGKTAIKDIVDFAVIAVQVIFGLLEAVLALIAALHWILNDGLPTLWGGIKFAFDAIVLGLTVIGALIVAFFRWLGQIIMDAVHAVVDAIFGPFDDVVKIIKRIPDEIRKIPDQIVTIFKDSARLLFNAGKNIIGGLIDGIKDQIPGLNSILSWISDHMPDWKGPEEKDKKLLVPAGQAVMEGFGAGIKAGAQDIRSMLTDFTSSLGGIGVNGANGGGITFGRDAIRISFEGALPTDQQAMSTGMAVGNGINGMLAQRNTRLAVRTL